MNNTALVTRRHEALGRRYRETPGEARIADHARAASVGSDPFHGTVVIGDSEVSLEFGIHRAVGGDHDLQNPGDMLCAALAACLDSTIRMLAARMNIALKALVVEVRAFADARGCLMLDRQVPVGFERIDIDVLADADDGIDPAQISRLVPAAERCCVVLQTLRGTVQVNTRFSGAAATAAAE